MKLTTFTHNNKTRIGLVVENEIIDTQQIDDMPATMLEFLERDLVNSVPIKDLVMNRTRGFVLDDVKLQAPIPRPPKFFGVGLNYLDHIEETGRVKPESPTIFNKQSTCIIGPSNAIHRPKVSDHLDYEGELGIVIGKRCRHVPKEKVKDVIAGYLIVNDVSVRDWQKRSPTMTLGKSFDTHGPIGPWIVTPDELGDPHNLNVNTLVNDELRQSSNTKHLLFDCYYLIEYQQCIIFCT